MAKKESYRAGLTSGINWRKTIVNFDEKTQKTQKKRLKKVKKESSYDLSEWIKGFRIGYDYERKRR